MLSYRLAFVAAVLGLAPIDASLRASVPAQQEEKGLTKEDAKLLESLLRDFLFDPRGAQRVEVRANVGYREETREGWLVKDKAGARVYFTDEESIAAPAKERITAVDFIAQCRERFHGTPPGDFPFLTHAYDPEWLVERSALVHAAWLFRLGKQDLAAQVMAHVPPDREAAVASLRQYLAEAALNRMMRLYASYKDEEALTQGERLLRLYVAEARELSQAWPLFRDLQRRKQRGTLGKRGTPGLPKQFAAWDVKKQLAHLLDALEDSDGSIDPRYETSPHFAALMKFGETAVPALLDVLDMDERMTRCVSLPGKWISVARVMAVREVAHGSLCEILRVGHLDPRDPNAQEYSFGPPDKKAYTSAREYWKEFGPHSFEERMMRVLNDARSSYPALREAAKNLAGEFGPQALPKGSVRALASAARSLAASADPGWPSTAKDGKPNPAVLKFKGPTAAEAILYALERELAHNESLRQTGQAPSHGEPLYFWALIRVGDRRIAPTLGKRAEKEPNALVRMRFAHASHRLGHSEPIRDFAREFSEGKITLATESGSPSRWQLDGIVEHLAAVKLLEADVALFKLADPGHRYHDATLEGLVDKAVGFHDHPYCVPMLRKLLDNKAATQTSLGIQQRANRIEQRRIERHERGWAEFTDELPIPAILADPTKRRAHADIRRCDLAAESCATIAGLPEYHPLLKDADARLAAMKATLDRFSGRYRRLTPAEGMAIVGNTYALWFGPDIKPLGRPATAEDVKAGKAVFHLDGKGTVAKLSLPARGTWKKTDKEQETRSCLIVQAEVGPDGEVLYGIIEQHGIRAVPARHFAEVKHLEELDTSKD